MMKKPLLVAKHLFKTFYYPVPVEILRDVSLEVCAGESIAIMGASGEGKSTLLHILGTLEPPTRGCVRIFDQEVQTKDAHRVRNQHIGFVFQRFHLFGDSSVLDNVLMPARIARKSVSKQSPAYQQAVDLLNAVGLRNRIHFPAKLLSGGEKQRVGIARALCNDPALLLADEPSGNLDHHTSFEIYDLLLSLAQASEKALITVTHDPELARRCQKTFTLREGSLHREPS